MSTRTVEIPRSLIIQAIRKEPLKGGQIFHRGERAANGKCSVCAVGAVLRRAFDEQGDHSLFGLWHQKYPEIWNSNLANYYNVSLIRSYYREGRYLAVLSNVFEKLYAEYIAGTGTMRELRSKLVSFVEEYFPEQVPVEVRK